MYFITATPVWLCSVKAATYSNRKIIHSAINLHKLKKVFKKKDSIPSFSRHSTWPSAHFSKCKRTNKQKCFIYASIKGYLVLNNKYFLGLNDDPVKHSPHVHTSI